MTPFPLRGDKSPATVSAADRRVVEAGPYTYTLHPGEDPLPATVSSVVPLVDERSTLWIEVFVQPAPSTLSKRPFERLLGVFRADWRPSATASWTRGEVFEVVVGPLRVSSVARPIVGELLRRLVDYVVAGGSPSVEVLRTDADAAISFDARARAAAPREFAALAAATRVLVGEGEEADDADPAITH